MFGKDRRFGCNGPGFVPVRGSAVASIFPFAVLADDHPVKITGSAVRKRGLSAPENFGGADVGVLLEGLAERETEAPEGNVVWYICVLR